MSTMTTSVSTALVQAKDALEFFAMIGRLKTLKRTGWIQHGLSLPESVADHMYRMSMTVFMLRDPTINKDHLIKVCLMHDVAEAIVGDITPADNVPADVKKRMELDAMQSIVRNIKVEELGNELLSLWLEYEEGNTPEGLVAKQLDKFEMIVQANEYEISQGKLLESFFESTKDYFHHPEIVAWNNTLRAERDIRLAASRS